MEPEADRQGGPSSAQQRMVERQLAERGVVDPRVLEAFRQVPRTAFVPESLKAQAYEDGPLPIGGGQTISQPYIVALTAQLLELRGDEHVLEVGTGSGYAAAILAELAEHVVTVERLADLCSTARRRLESLGYRNVQVCCGDGTRGWPAAAPYDAIAVTAGGAAIPDALLEQLGPGGRLVMPVGPPQAQVLTRVMREASGRLRKEPVAGVRFVPLIGDPAPQDVEHPPSAPGAG